MWSEKPKRTAADPPGAGEAAGDLDGLAACQPVTGVSGRLRPYPDVRAGFEPWRRIALRLWAAREESTILH